MVPFIKNESSSWTRLRDNQVLMTSLPHGIAKAEKVIFIHWSEWGDCLGGHCCLLMRKWEIRSTRKQDCGWHNNGSPQRCPLWVLGTWHRVTVCGWRVGLNQASWDGDIIWDYAGTAKVTSRERLKCPRQRGEMWGRDRRRQKQNLQGTDCWLSRRKRPQTADWAASRSWKRQGNNSLPEPPRRN